MPRNLQGVEQTLQRLQEVGYVSVTIIQMQVALTHSDKYAVVTVAVEEWVWTRSGRQKLLLPLLLVRLDSHRNPAENAGIDLFRSVVETGLPHTNWPVSCACPHRLAPIEPPQAMGLTIVIPWDSP